MMIKLAHCPFCGKKPTGPEICDTMTNHTSWWIECLHCEIVMSRDGKKQLVNDWNTRCNYYPPSHDVKDYYKGD